MLKKFCNKYIELIKMNKGCLPIYIKIIDPVKIKDQINFNNINNFFAFVYHICMICKHNIIIFLL